MKAGIGSEFTVQAVGSLVYGGECDRSGVDLSVLVPGARESLLRWFLVDRLRYVGVDIDALKSSTATSSVIRGAMHGVPVCIRVGEEAELARESTAALKNAFNNYRSRHEDFRILKSWLHNRGIVASHENSSFAWSAEILSFFATHRTDDTGKSEDAAQVLLSFCQYLRDKFDDARETNLCDSTQQQAYIMRGPQYLNRELLRVPLKFPRLHREIARAEKALSENGPSNMVLLPPQMLKSPADVRTQSHMSRFSRHDRWEQKQAKRTHLLRRNL